MTMPAVVFTADGRIALQDRPRPTLRPDQVLVEVDMCGICGSDLHASELPQVYRGDCILGHESTGRIAAVGGDIADWAVGQRVAVNPNGNVDGTCVYCRSGRPNFSVRRPLWRRRWAYRQMERWQLSVTGWSPSTRSSGTGNR
jgi:D-arabinose 1-dehydrogenase-like Zn-dependent alcohol dehydrogenase